MGLCTLVKCCQITLIHSRWYTDLCNIIYEGNEKASHEETKRICFALWLTVIISHITDCSSRNALLLCGAGYRRQAVLSHQEKFPFAVWQVIITQTVHHHELFTFTFMHLADAFIQSDLQCIQAIHLLSVCVPWELNPQPFALLTQSSTTEPQEYVIHICIHIELYIFECLWPVCINLLCISACTFCVYVFVLREVLASEALLNIPMRADWRECKCTKEEEEDQAKQMRSDFEPFNFSHDDWATFQIHLTWSLRVNELECQLLILLSFYAF